MHSPTCHLTFQTTISYSFGSNAQPSSIIVTDLNGDDRPDIAVTNINTANIGVLLGNGDGTFQAATLFSTGNNSLPDSIAAGDFNSDGHQDLAFVNSADYNLDVVFGRGDGTFGPLMTNSNGYYSSSSLLVVGDFNNDNHLDLAVLDYWGYHSIGVLLGSGDGTFPTQTRFNLNICDISHSFAVGDFDSNGQLDLAVTDSYSNYLCVLLGNGNGYFDEPIIYSTGSYSDPSSIAVGDFNNDSWLDVAIANYRENNIGVFLGNGSGIFGVQTTFATGYNSNPGTVVTGDFNNDDQLDIAVSHWETRNIGVFLGTGNGTFLAQTKFSIGTSYTSNAIATGDFNNDGKLDLAVIDQSQYDIIILLNTCDCCVH